MMSVATARIATPTGSKRKASFPASEWLERPSKGPVGAKSGVRCEVGKPCEDEPTASGADANGSDEANQGRVCWKDDHTTCHLKQSESVRGERSDQNADSKENAKRALKATVVMPEEHGSESRDHIGTSHSHLVNLVRERLGVQYSTECPWYPVCRRAAAGETDGIGTDGRTTLRSSGHETDENESRAGCGSEQRRIERRSRMQREPQRGSKTGHRNECSPDLEQPWPSRFGTEATIHRMTQHGEREHTANDYCEVDSDDTGGVDSWGRDHSGSFRPRTGREAPPTGPQVFVQYRWQRGGEAGPLSIPCE